MEYICKQDVELMGVLFLKGDCIHIMGCERVMDGNMDYGRKVFNNHKQYLGMLRDSHFENISNCFGEKKSTSTNRAKFTICPDCGGEVLINIPSGNGFCLECDYRVKGKQ